MRRCFDTASNTVMLEKLHTYAGDKLATSLLPLASGLAPPRNVNKGRGKHTLFP